MAKFLSAITGVFALVFLTCSLPSFAYADETQSGAAGTGIVPALFGSTEIRSNNISSFTNWTGVLSRFKQAELLGEGMCASAGVGGSRECVWDKWQGQIAAEKGKSPLEQLRDVNRAMNRQRYTIDPVNWGMDDYWATVFEFLRKNGDCEDYAVAKYVTLKALGWPTEKLRIVIVRDTKLDLNHAILAVYTDQGVYIADNQVTDIVRADSIRHYRPIYSINENSWWLHRPQRR